ncbi:MAG TPA: TAT-variant-translocated molybdopterin oxidoreductase [Candidatus Sulfotelmatobacter sp.]|nr:TAT-variant-translocated molybdopterin oxidoreductase [Candidatus Sulfotelmatobacter sp.]
MNDKGNERKLRILQDSLVQEPVHDQGRHHIEDHQEDDAEREHRLDLASVREKLRGKTGKQYWRTLEELADDPHFEELLHREFPRHASEWDEAVDRRDFLKLMGASLAFAGLAGCGRPDIDHIVPYVKQPDGMILGRPSFFATAMPFGADAIGVLVESHEGRPTKIEGNPDHPSSLGATSAQVQASILNLYDPDRSQTVQNAGEIRSWSAFLDAAQALATNVRATRGAGFRILSGTVTSLTLTAQIRNLLAQNPEAKWYQWEPAGADGAREGAKLAFGRNVNTVYQVGKANVIVSLDADFLACGPGHLANARQFARRRKLDGPNDAMNRLYVVEPTPSVTGSSADHRLPLRSSDVELFARALAGKLGIGPGASLSGEAAKWVEVVAKELQKEHGTSLVIAGEYQPAAVHALAHAMNAALGNVGATLYYTEPVSGDTAGNLESIRDLCAEMDSGKVDLLLMLGANPVYDAPHDFDFVNKLKRVPTAIQLSQYFDETSAWCQWHVAESHYLETWSDVRAHDGTASIIQPLVAPLYYTHSAHEVVAAFSDKPGLPAYEAVRAYWTEASVHLESSVDTGWRKWLNDGVISGTKSAPTNPELKFNAANLPPFRSAPADQIEFIFRPDPAVHDGRFANNGWLQELPKPVTKLTWDNAALVSPKMAQKMDLVHKVQSRGGEHGQVRSPLVDIELNGSKVTAAAWTLPGQAENTVVLPLGYGRTRAGFTGSNKGFNAYVVRTSNALWSATDGKMTPTGESYPLACTQYHFNMEGRQILSTATLEEYRKNPDFAHEHAELPPKNDSLYHEFAYPGYAWGMAIDLNKCIGCNACVIACVAENNIPVVGKDQVMRAREMHWIRIDRYYTNTESATSGKSTGDPTEYQPALDNPETFFQPVPCQQCENAPCEQVCPVGATVHSAEGLNDMVYNRCIGTRYCSNNCPYKVRRFNFLRFQDWDTPQLKLMRNPEVTVRSRGVMEKCTYCVQRINNVRIEAEKQNRPIRDGEIVTACEAACPSEAIRFGNANDPNSRVAKLKAQQRNYTLLGELNSRPRTTYLAAVRNPNPELEKA